MPSLPTLSQLRIAAASSVLAGVAIGGFFDAAQAFRPDASAVSLEVLPGLGQYQFYHTSSELSGDPAVAAYTAMLRAELGPQWEVESWNQYSGTARSVQGAGVVVSSTSLASASREDMESIARSFIADHADLFFTDGSNLRVVKVAHGMNRWGVIFEQYLDGVRIDGSQVVLAIHDNGRLFAFGANLYPDADVSARPSIDLAAAQGIARNSVPFDPTLDYEVGADDLVILPIHHGIGDVEYRLAHQTDVPVRQPLGVYRTWVDAHDGEIIYRDNQVEFAYSGTTSGDAEEFSPCDGDSPGHPQPNMTVNIEGVGSVDSDGQGNFSIPGNAGTRNFTAAFDGPDFNVNCSGCGGDALFTGTIDPDSPEAIYYDSASFRPDERDAYHFTNRTKQFAESIDPDFAQSKYVVNVNVSGCCNANWSTGTMNFYREGCGCANMARVSDVVAHEFGHGIQNWALGGGQGPQGLGEGNGDITSTFITGNSIVGIGVNDCVSGARYCDNDLVYPDDLNGQIHHDGQIICGFNWDVRLNLEAIMSYEDAKAHTAALWLFSRKLYMTQANNQPDQAERYLWVDDDNANLFDGTPHWNQICDSREKHGYGECFKITTDVDPIETSAASLRLLEATPNPFGGSTSIRYSLQSEGAIELGIFDASGRLVRSLVSDVRGSGVHVADWDGMNDAGQPVASGTYFYRLESGDSQETRSLTLIK